MRVCACSLRDTWWGCVDANALAGKRYRRQDEIGTPVCVTVDHQTLEDGTVTLRCRDSMEQVRARVCVCVL